MSNAIRPSVIPGLVEEHFDELDWLWEHREANLFSADWDLQDLAHHEARVEAHVDALRLTGELGVEFARDLLAQGEESPAAAATLLLCTGRGRARRGLRTGSVVAGQPSHGKRCSICASTLLTRGAFGLSPRSCRGGGGLPGGCRSRCPRVSRRFGGQLRNSVGLWGSLDCGEGIGRHVAHGGASGTRGTRGAEESAW